jgi:hypothetical protein
MDPESAALQIALPPYLPPVGIIAGSLDGKVKVEDTALPDGMKFVHTVVDCTHAGVRRPENTGNLVLKFFKEKKFD